METCGFGTKMDCTQKGCQKDIARDLSMSPRADRGLRILGNGPRQRWSGTPSGCLAHGRGGRRFRAAQPPAIICEPSGFKCAGSYVRTSRSPTVALI